MTAIKARRMSLAASRLSGSGCRGRSARSTRLTKRVSRVMWRPNGFVLSFFGLVALGCGVGDYEERYASRVQQYRDESELAVLDKEYTFFTPEIGVRIPRGFGQAKAQSATSVLGDFQGFKGAFATSVQVDGQEVMAPLVVAVRHGAKTVELEENLTLRVRQMQGFKDHPLRWETREAQSLVGGAAAVWRVLSIRGSMPFYNARSSDRASTKAEGLLECWLSADREQESLVVLVWQMPGMVSEPTTQSMANLPSLVSRTLTRRVNQDPVSTPLGSEESRHGE